MYNVVKVLNTNDNKKTTFIDIETIPKTTTEVEEVSGLPDSNILETQTARHQVPTQITRAMATSNEKSQAASL